MRSKNIAVQVKQLHKSYGDNHVLKGISFNVERGKMLALLGPNGAGKTTTVRILSTLLQPDKGAVKVDGHDAIKDPEAVRSVIGLTGQSAAVDELLTGRENLIMMGRLYRLTKASARARTDELLTDFDLMEAADRPAKTYSGGMRRRLDLAVSLIAVPPVIFLDEPTTGLDPRSRLVMWDIIKKLLADGATIVLTTQYLEEADQLADSIIVIDDGKIIAEGSAKELKRKIGEDRLVLTFKNASTLTQANKLLGSSVLDSDTANLNLTVLVKDTNKDVRTVLEAFAKANIYVDNIDIHKPTLDDVFMRVTNKSSKKTAKQKGKS